MSVPTYVKLFNPVLQALHELGGSGSVVEIEEKVARILKLSEQEINEIHRGSRTKLNYRLSWSRNYLKRYGLLESSSKGVWALTARGRKIKRVDDENVDKLVKKLDRTYNRLTDLDEQEELSEIKPGQSLKRWQDILLDKITSLSPEAFERLSQRILRELGFTQVEIQGKTGDKGIDGRGIMKISLLTFPIIFQCKRYNGTISSQQVRDFRGAMSGRVEKGLFITTGRFTLAAKQEATREGTPPIDLIDGEELVENMKKLRLGVRDTFVVDDEWFKSF